MTYKQLSDKLQSPFDNAEDAAMRLAGITGMVGIEIASAAFKSYKTKQVSIGPAMWDHLSKMSMNLASMRSV